MLRKLLITSAVAGVLAAAAMPAQARGFVSVGIAVPPIVVAPGYYGYGYGPNVVVAPGYYGGYGGYYGSYPYYRGGYGYHGGYYGGYHGGYGGYHGGYAGHGGYHR